jgi:polyketide-type polyunsaturated fatty acid synthase PfaA
LPQLPEVDTAALAQLRTLQHVVEYLHQLAGSAVPTELMPATAASTVVPTPVAAHSSLPAVAKVLPQAQIQSAMLNAVSEKTGYPIDMLELSMDMEADLGIDSIKRVEILGAVQAAQPLLAAADSAHLSGLRTLQDVVTYLNEFSAITPEPSAAESDVVLSESSFHHNGQDGTQIDATGTADATQITGIMLAAVAEKTGYPVDMLELSMDMEGDLGIDSIKRVEIMGAVQQAVPGLAEFDSAALAELRTLAQVAAYLTGLQSQAPRELADEPQQKQPMASQADLVSVVSAVAVLKPLPELTTKPVKQSSQPVCVITDDGSEVSQVLLRRMKKLGWHVKVATFEGVAGIQTKLKVDSADLIPLSDMAAAKTAIDAIHHRYGGLDAFIYLQPTVTVAEPELQQSDEQVLRQLFLTAGLLKHPLTEGAKLEKAVFITVNRLDGQLGYGASQHAHPVQGAALGLVKTLAQEWPQVQCKALDIDPQLASDVVAERILQELQHDDGVTEIGYGPQGRVTVETTQAQGNDSYQLHNESVLLVSAGGRGVTASCILALAQQQPCRFILVGRSVLAAEEAGWARGITEVTALKQSALADAQSRGEKLTPKALGYLVDAVLAQREIQNTIEQLQQVGAKVVYISADITDQASLAAPLRQAEASFGKVTGIVHGAGVLADKLIEHKTALDFDRVFNTKIHGLKTMLSCVEPEKLTHLALFSSVAGFYGNVGQSDYAMANEAMNKIAMDFGNRHPACRVVSFNWGPWDGGMVTDELKKLFEERNISLIPIAEGGAIFCNKMLSGSKTDRITVVGQALSQQTPNPAQKTMLLHKVIKATDNPFLQDHRIGNNAVLPVVMALTWMANDVETLYPGYRFYKCEQFKLFKGLVFDGLETELYQLQAEELSHDGDDVVVQVRIFSDNGRGGYFNHYGARLTLCKSAHLATAHYSAFDKHDQAVATGQELYQGPALFHGPTFQAIESVLNWDRRRMTLKCREKTASSAVQGQFPVQSFNPYVADVEFQGLLVWVHQFYGAASLPSDGGELTLYRTVPAGEQYYVSLEIIEHSKTRVVADIYVHDSSGQLYTRMLGAAVAVSTQLGRLFAV